MQNSKIIPSLAILVALGAVLYLTMSRPDEPEIPVDEVPEGTALRPTPQSPGSNDRVGKRRLPQEDNGDPGLLRIAERAVKSSQGPIAYLGTRPEGDRRFGELEGRIQVIDAEPFGERHSRAALAAMQEMGASFLMVSMLDPPIAPWPPDTASTIHELLRDGVPPPSFQPLVIGRAHILYRVAPSLELSAEQQKAITAYMRARLTGSDPPPLEGLPDERARAHDGRARVIVALRWPEPDCNYSRALTRRQGAGRTIRDALDHAAEQHRHRWPRTRRRSPCEDRLPAEFPEAMERITLQIEVVHRMAAITDRTRDRLYYLLELGREGAYLQRDNRTLLLSPNQTIHRAMENELSVSERVGEWNDLSEESWLDRRYEFGRFETIAWLEPTPGGDPRELYRGVPLVRLDDITRESLVEALSIGAHYLRNSQTTEGEYRYIYRPLRREVERRWTTENNIVRHGLCPLTVLRAHKLNPDPLLLDSAKKAIDFSLSHLKRTGDRCYIWHQDDGSDEPNAKMGVVAATIMSLAELSSIEPLGEYQDELDCLANQLIAMQEESGRFIHYDVERGHPYYGRHNTIYPGEIMLALSMLYRLTSDERFRQAFDRAMRYQQNWFRDTREETEEDGIYNERRRVDLISFEPWGIMAVDDMYRQTNDERYEEFGFELVEFMDGLFHYDLGRAQYADYLGGYFKTQLELPAINSCGYTEGAAAAFAIALRAGRNIEERRLSLLLGLRFVLQLQYHPDRSLFHVPDPESAHGGFRYNLSFSRIRNDYMYHALNALALAAASLRPEDYPENLTFEDVPEILEPAFRER